MDNVTLEILRAKTELRSYMMEFKDYNTTRVDGALRILKVLYESSLLNCYDKVAAKANAQEDILRRMNSFMNSFDTAETHYKRKYYLLLQKHKRLKESLKGEK